MKSLIILLTVNYLYGSVLYTDMTTTKQMTVASQRMKALREIKEMYEGRVKTLKAIQQEGNIHYYDSAEFRRAELLTLEMVIGDLSAVLGD